MTGAREKRGEIDFVLLDSDVVRCAMPFGIPWTHGVKTAIRAGWRDFIG